MHTFFFLNLVALQQYNDSNEEAIIQQRSAISSEGAARPAHHIAPGYNSCHKKDTPRPSGVMGVVFWLLTVHCSGRSRARWLRSLLPSHSRTLCCLLHWRCRGCSCSRRRFWGRHRSPVGLHHIPSHSPCWLSWRTLWSLEGKQVHYYKDSMQAKQSLMELNNEMLFLTELSSWKKNQTMFIKSCRFYCIWFGFFFFLSLSSRWGRVSLPKCLLEAVYSTAQLSGVSKPVPTTEILIIRLITKVDINTSIGESKVLTDEERSCGVIFAHIPHIFAAQSLSTPRPGQGKCFFFPCLGWEK